MGHEFQPVLVQGTNTVTVCGECGGGRADHQRGSGLDRSVAAVYNQPRGLSWVLGLTPDLLIWHHRRGSVSDREARLYKLVWVWSAPRFSNLFGAEESRSRYARKCGWPAVVRREARARAWLERLRSSNPR